VIGHTTLNAIAAGMQRQVLERRCLGSFVLAVQEALYGSCTGRLSASQWREIQSFLKAGCSSGDRRQTRP
jgi:hypothetical protein